MGFTHGCFSRKHGERVGVAMIGGCCGALQQCMRRYLKKDGDSEAYLRRKVVVASFVAIHWVIFLVAMFFLSAAWDGGLPYFYFVIILTFTVQGLWLAVVKEASDVFLRMCVVSWCVAAIYIDLLSAAAKERLWPVFIVQLDLLLVIDAPKYMTKGVVAVVMVWLLVVEVEYETRSVGLLDTHDSVEGWTYDQRRGMCDCEKPPCANDTGVAGAVLTLLPVYFLFLVDFYLTRGFAEESLAEKRKMSMAMAAAEHIAGRLADFDLEAAAAYLEAHSDGLPEEMTASFLTLLQNLHSYRPYLPDDVFATDSKASCASPNLSPMATTAPGVRDSGWVALAFTDIRSSTALWDANPYAMHIALDMHSETVRTALAENGGYEVKTIGDAFMIAFPTSMQAVSFGGAAQTNLVATQWPDGLTRPNLDDGFGLLTVRMGIHCGEVTAQRNTLTGRFDYFGPTVNRASRVECFGAPGAVTVTADVLEDVGGDAALEEGFTMVPYADVRRGKGLTEPLVLTALVPCGAAGITECVRRVADEKVDQTVSPARADDLISMSTDDDVTSPSDHPLAAATTPQGSDVTDMVMPLRPLVSQRQVFTGASVGCGCVGVVKFDYDYRDAGAGDAEVVARAGRRLQALHMAVEATRGHLSAVVNSVAWMSWGLRGTCTQFVNESARCMLLLRERLAGDGPCVQDAPPAFHAGLATGPLAAIELAPSARGRRFVTLFGACVSLGDTLCHAAAAVRTCVLVGALGGSASDSHAGQVGNMQWMGKWVLDAEGAVEVYELILAELASAVDAKDDNDMPLRGRRPSLGHRLAPVSGLNHAFVQLRSCM